MGFFSFLGVLSPVYTVTSRIFSGAKFVGEDVYGNKYYTAKPRPGYKRERRWVSYNGAPEASKIPPEWHGWMHHQSDEVPENAGKSFRRKWQKPHQPNMTGTSVAYLPPGHLLKGGKRDQATGDYEAWRPPE
ncbi:MAG: NADH:ubiquinone oxidoreductase subunit NDUFA12 [Alphaproteobacteria bacterium]|nr:NADH:ubiquinone oxidoreductase subunit NDUFA12 [Alphaproteobacteria bacterium]